MTEQRSQSPQPIDADNRGLVRPPGLSIIDLADRQLTTVNGRPLSELRAPDAFRRRLAIMGVPFEHHSHHLQDSRGEFPNRPFNYSAFKELTTGKQGVLDAFAWIHDNYFAGGKHEQVTLGQLVELVDVAQALPSYLVLRGQDPIDGRKLPNIVGNMKKTALGIASTAKGMAKNLPLDDTYTDAQLVYDFANTAGILIGDKQVCPAPRSLITQMTDALLRGEGGVAGRSELNTLVPDFDTLLEYSSMLGRLETNYEAFRHNSMAVTRWRMNDKRLDVRTHDIGFLEFLDTQEAIVADVGALQNRVNEVLGRDPSTVSVPTYDDVKDNAIRRDKIVIQDTPYDPVALRKGLQVKRSGPNRVTVREINKVRKDMGLRDPAEWTSRQPEATRTDTAREDESTQLGQQVGTLVFDGDVGVDGNGGYDYEGSKDDEQGGREQGRNLDDPGAEDYELGDR